MNILAAFWSLSPWRDAVRGLGALICNAIYSLISWIYQLFVVVSKVNLLSDDAVAPIYQRVTMILTIVMTFYITFEFVKYLIEPDNMTDKEKGVGGILKRIVIVIVMIAFVPQMFSLAYKLQNTIINNQVLSKIILGTQSTDPDKFGNELSANILGLFYEVDNDNCPSLTGECKEASDKVEANLERLRTTGKANILDGINISAEKTILAGTSDSPAIAFNGIMAILVGGFIAVILVLYSIDLGIRYAQLVFLQIIAPIAIIGYLSPKKDNMFAKWGGKCISTYLDLFLRIALIYFVILIIKVLGTAMDNGTLLANVGEISKGVRNFTYVALVLGLLAFAKRAPKLLEDIMPKGLGGSGIGMGFGIKDRGIGLGGRIAGAAAGTAIGAAVGLGTGIHQGLRRKNAALAAGKSAREARKAAAIGAISGGTRGFVGGGVRGLSGGAKKGNVLKNSVEGAKRQVESNKQYGNRQEAGYTIKDQMNDRFRNLTGRPSRVEELEAQKAPLKKLQDIYTADAKTNDAIREHALKKAGDTGLESYARYAAAQGRLQKLQQDQFIEITDATGRVQRYDSSSDEYIRALQQVTKDMKAYKDRATNEYLDSKRQVAADGSVHYTDGKIEELMQERNQRYVDYNTYAANMKIDGVDMQVAGINNPVEVYDNSGRLIYSGLIKDMNAEQYDAYVKNYANVHAADISRNISAKTAKQESIKGQTEGSGVNEGGKK